MNGRIHPASKSIAVLAAILLLATACGQGPATPATAPIPQRCELGHR